MITVHFSLSGLVGMFTKPYWPALMDAFERQDTPWIIRTSNRLRMGGLGFAFLAGIGLVALGPIVLKMWAGEEFYTSVSENFQMDRVALLAFAAYFMVHIWRHINQTLALGIGWISPVAKVVVAEAIFLISVTSFTLLHEGSIGTMYLAMAGSIALFSGWLFPLFFRRGRGDGAISPEEFLVEPEAPILPPLERIELRQNEGKPQATGLHK
jgi:hypothetical protein